MTPTTLIFVSVVKALTEDFKILVQSTSTVLAGEMMQLGMFDLSHCIERRITVFFISGVSVLIIFLCVLLKLLTGAILPCNWNFQFHGK